MTKFSPERAKELQPIPRTIRPKIGGKTLYRRILIARKHTIAYRHENRLFIGAVVCGEVVAVHEVHPDTISKEIICEGSVREISFGEMFRIASVETCGEP